MKGQITKQTFRIPIEIFLDVCRMIQTGNLGNKILGSNEALGEVIAEFSFLNENPIQKAAIKNIQESVAEWNQQRYGEEDPEEISLS